MAEMLQFPPFIKYTQRAAQNGAINQILKRQSRLELFNYATFTTYLQTLIIQNCPKLLSLKHLYLTIALSL